MKRCTKPSAVPRNLKQPKWQILHNCPESHNDFLVENQRPDEDMDKHSSGIRIQNSRLP